MVHSDRMLGGGLRRALLVRRNTALFLTMLLLVAATTLGSSATSASAGVGYDYCTGYISAYDNCTGSYVNLYASQVYDNYNRNRVCAGAVYSGSFYGSYACGSGYASQCYGFSGPKPLAPRIHNGENYAQQMHGHAYTDQCP